MRITLEFEPVPYRIHQRPVVLLRVHSGTPFSHLGSAYQEVFFPLGQTRGEVGWDSLYLLPTHFPELENITVINIEVCQRSIKSAM